jgi:diaminobutyrate-2-oxoglutarate transaminase
LAPDLVVLSKSISGYGLPIALLLIRPEYDVWKPGEHNGTFRGNAHAFVTGRTHWKSSGVAASSNVRSRPGARWWGTLVADRGSCARRPLQGSGMMQGVDVGSQTLAAEIQQRCFDHGLVIETSEPNDEIVNVFPALTTPVDILECGLDILQDSVEASILSVSSKLG